MQSMKRRFLVVFIITILILMLGLATKSKSNQEEIMTIGTSIKNTSKSCVVMDVNTEEVLFDYFANTPHLPASITKLLTLYVCLQLYQLDDYVIITKEMINVEGSRIYLEEGDCLSVEMLLYGMMLCSGNDAALALALHYDNNLEDFMMIMNDTAKLIGMKNSYFNNPHGLDSENENYVTAYDMGLLVCKGMKNETFKKIIGQKKFQDKSYSNKSFYFHNKHRLLFNSSKAIGGKTGYTKKAGRTLVTVFEEDNNQVVVVTLDAYSDWELHKNLSSYGFEKIRLRRSNQVSKYLTKKISIAHRKENDE